MQKFKRMGRCVTGLLLALVLSLPVSALAIQTPISNALIPSVPVVPMEIPKSDNQGHLVSLVRRSQYSGATVVGCLEDGTRISVLKTAGDFYRIDCYDMTGYIAKSQVQVNENGEYVVKCDPESKESKYLPSYSSQEAPPHTYPVFIPKCCGSIRFTTISSQEICCSPLRDHMVHPVSSNSRDLL